MACHYRARAKVYAWPHVSGNSTISDVVGFVHRRPGKGRNYAFRMFRSSGWITVLKYIRRTATKTGLTVMARLVTKTYRTGQVPTKKDFARVEIKHHDVLPAWNYTIAPAL